MYGPPLAACTIEIGEGPDQSSRFKDVGDGILDTKTGLTWSKQAGVQMRYIDVPGENPGVVTYLKNKGGGWRLPTREELVDLRKVGGQKPYVWFNAHGFTGAVDDAYWTSRQDGERLWVVEMGATRDPGVMDTSDKGQLWAVKGL